jgi:hypothetical protein
MDQGMAGYYGHRMPARRSWTGEAPTSAVARSTTIAEVLRLLGSGLKEARCEACGITEWQGRPAPLQVDHVDGDRLNNELLNLRMMCANCHMQTETWGFKNARRRPRQALVAEVR